MSSKIVNAQVHLWIGLGLLALILATGTHFVGVAAGNTLAATPPNTPSQSSQAANAAKPPHSTGAKQQAALVDKPNTSANPGISASAPLTGEDYVIEPSTGATVVPGVTDSGNHSDDGTTAITLPFTFNLYGVPYAGANVSSNGNLQFNSAITTFTNGCLPDVTFNATIFPHWDDLETVTGLTGCTAFTNGCGVFTDVLGSAPNRTFVIEWHAVYFNNTAQHTDFEVKLYEGQDAFDVVYGQVDQGGSSATVGVQRNAGSGASQYECNNAANPLSSGLMLHFRPLGAGEPTQTPTFAPPTSTPTITFTPSNTFTVTPSFTPTPTITGTPPTVTPTSTPTVSPTPFPTCGPLSDYVISSSTGAAIDPGTTDIGNHGDDVVTNIGLPFTYNLYGQPFTTVNVSSNGNLQFTSALTTFTNNCLPDTTSGMNNLIAPHWDDLNTTVGLSGCATYANGCGVFTSLSGTAPNRVFNIEWHAVEFANNANLANFEVKLYESGGRFDVVYGTVTSGGVSATVGVQRGPGTSFTQYECNTGGLSSGLQLVFQQPVCGGPTFTPTSTPCGVPAGWSAGPAMPTVHTRAVGVWFASLNRFYVMGGRSSDTAGSDLLNPRYYSPISNTWTVDTAASFPDNQVNNMVCADLNGPGGHQIYCVGGSAAGATVATNRVAVYDPNAHTITTLASDPWPAESDGITLPGGQAVVNNKLYILGGFRINTNMSNKIWEFDPNRTAGSRWVLKAAVVPNAPNSVGMGYIPAAAVGTNIYTGGGSQFVPGSPPTIADSTIAFKYDTLADTVDDAGVPDLPSPGNGETRALNVNGKVWLIGGGRTSPNPSANVLEFDPANPGAGWVVRNSFAGARRNFPVDIDPLTGNIYLAGGYQPSTPTNTMQIYSPGVPCTTATPTPTSGPSGIVNGHLTWQGIAQPSNNNIGVTATLVLCNGASQVYSGQSTTNNTGNIVFIIGLPDGTYNWKIKGVINLGNAGTLTISGGTATVEFGLLRAGDSNNSNNVNATDFNIVKNSFGKAPGQVGYDDRANFNRDGAVNSTDFNLLKTNFGQAGALQTCP